METSKDSTLHVLCENISLGWPENIAHCPTHVMPFWNFRDELNVEDGLILKGQRIILQKSLHAAALEQIHYAHQGAEKCKLRAKAAVFWCSINHDIDETVKSCAPCQAHQVATTKETLIPHDVPKHAWHTLATYLFHWNGTEYMLIADLYNKFPLIRKLTNMSSSTIINRLKGIFKMIHVLPFISAQKCDKNALQNRCGRPFLNKIGSLTIDRFLCVRFCQNLPMYSIFAASYLQKY